MPFGIKSPKDVHAVKEIYMEVQKNELLCLLGHNGAGKSTLFGMMTGMIAPSFGEAKICGLDVKKDQEKIRKLMGVVP
jgi:ABC-type multidrug transport system ATPase subunit